MLRILCRSRKQYRVCSNCIFLLIRWIRSHKFQIIFSMTKTDIMFSALVSFTISTRMLRSVYRKSHRICMYMHTHTHTRTLSNTLTHRYDPLRLAIKSKTYALLATACALAQITVLIRQMRSSGTNAAAASVSVITIGMQGILDAYLCIGHLIIGIAYESSFKIWASVAFLQFFVFSIFEMRFMLTVWKAMRSVSLNENPGWNNTRQELGYLYVVMFEREAREYYFHHSLTHNTHEHQHSNTTITRSWNITRMHMRIFEHQRSNTGTLVSTRYFSSDSCCSTSIGLFRMFWFCCYIPFGFLKSCTTTNRTPQRLLTSHTS